jgi:hypothetical protein
MLKLLSAAWITLALFSDANLLRAQSSEPIEDNSFLIEEAYNQKSGEVQHIFNLVRSYNPRELSFNFAQEWPLWGQEHQISYDLPFEYDFNYEQATLGEVAINYRYQVLGVEEHDIALAPRLSVLAALGDGLTGHGTGGIGVELGVPLSVILLPELVSHTNASVTYFPSATLAPSVTTSYTSFGLGQSLVLLLHPKFNVLVEAVWSRESYGSTLNDVEGEESFVINPGVRWAYDLNGGLQIVPGLSVPIGSDGNAQLLVYLSFEHDF